jgi:hypothetical protein
MKTIILKSKRGNEKEYPHTDVYCPTRNENIYLGYFIKNNSKYAVENQNWDFVPKNPNFVNKYFHTRTKKEMINKIITILNE